MHVFRDSIKVTLMSQLSLFEDRHIGTFSSYPIQPFYPTSPEWASVADCSTGSKTTFPTGNKRVFLDDSFTAQVTSCVHQGSILGTLHLPSPCTYLTSSSLSKDSKIMLYGDNILLYINPSYPLPSNWTSTWLQSGFPTVA